MLAKAHITIGMAAAFTAVMPESIPEALPVIAGASLGCLICDIDCENSREKTDFSKWRIFAVLLAAAALVADFHLEAEMSTHIMNGNKYLLFAGAAGMIMVCTFASISSHRGFSHSLLALGLEAASLWLILPSAVLPFVIAFLSHILLDLTNKKPLRLMYPMKNGFCLKWFYADRLANKVCEFAGAVWLAAALIISL